MSYNQRIKQSKEKVYNHAIATKILDLMDKLRLDQNNLSGRRWIWELLQNAKDVAFDSIGVSININFKTNGSTGILEFLHNGKPFTVDNVTFLIEQVSTKERKSKEGKPKTTGKFGTGFLTTHLLSEKVEVESFIKETDLPYNKFSLLLDRSGKEINEIINSVNNSLSTLESLDSNEQLEENSLKNLNTKFIYKLDKTGIEVARIGLNDLHTSLPFTLSFIPELTRITIENENIFYEVSQNVSNEGNQIKVYTILKSSGSEKKEKKLAILSKNNSTIAVEIEYRDGIVYLKEFDSSLPKLFCDFPLIGSEDFAFPVIINSSNFNPTEPRNGVYLTDREDIKIEENKAIIRDALQLYDDLLNYASENNWQNIYVLAKMSNPYEKEWISGDWLKEEVSEPIRQKLLTTPIVDLENGNRASILDMDKNPNIFFPFTTSNNEIRERIWELSHELFPNKLPRRKDIGIWQNIIWKDCYKQTLEELTKDIENKKNISDLSEDLGKTEDKTIEWLNSYYDLLNLEGKVIEEIKNNYYSVIPNQNGNFKKMSDLFLDNNIETELIKVLFILEIDAKEYLRHKKVNTSNKYADDKKKSSLLYKMKEEEQVIKEINEILEEGKNEHIQSVCNYLITLFPNESKESEGRAQIYEFCKRVFPIEISEIVRIKKNNPEIWKISDKLQIKRIVNSISELTNVQTLMQNFDFENETAAIKWLNHFIEFLIKKDMTGYLNKDGSAILPNQNGIFVVKDNLFLDNGEMDEALKDISKNLGHDFREELLDKNIYLEFPMNKTRNVSDIAEQIIKLITPKFSELPRSEKTREIFNKLFMWFRRNNELAEQIFGDLFVNKHKLYDDEEIAENMEKAEKYTELLQEFGVNNIDELRKVLESTSISEPATQKEQITQQSLLSLGVTSLEEFEKAFENKDLAARFVHTSKPTFEMFEYVQKIIERAKKNVIEFLTNQTDYDCSELEEVATTVLAGITKNKLPIYVVVRPSDNGEVIIYYTSEKDSLDYTNAELWIENGISDPIHLTLGKILKTTGITRIPV